MTGHISLWMGSFFVTLVAFGNAHTAHGLVHQYSHACELHSGVFVVPPR
jgi:hypothetical protein